MLEAERDEGNIEYKYYLENESDELYKERKITQFAYRLENGDNKAVLYIGITDDGTPVGLTKDKLNENILFVKKIFQHMKVYIENLQISDCVISIDKMIDPYKKLFEKINNNELTTNIARYVARISFHRPNITLSTTQPYTPLRVTVAGNVDSGKSTLIGVLTRQELDDGNGKMRQCVFRYPHEKTTGRTSSVSCEYMQFNINGNVIKTNKKDTFDFTDTSRICTFFDSPGHAKYYKTTAKNICASMPDYSIIVVGSNMGVTEMTKEHMIVSYINDIPMCVVLTKIDLCPSSVYETIIKRITRIAESIKMKFMLIEDDISMWNYCNQITEKKILPVIPVSNKTGKNIDLLTNFIKCLPCMNSYEEKINNPLYFSIQDDYAVPGVGTVVYGLIMDGKINAKSTYWLGPDNFGKFKKVFIKSIQNKRQNINTAVAGQDVTVCLRNIPRNEIVNGMVIIESATEPKGYYSFRAKITVVGSQSRDKVMGTHSTTIRENFEPVVHIGNVRQSAKIIKINKILEKPVEKPSDEKLPNLENKEEELSKTVLRVGDSAFVHFAMKYRPVYMRQGMHILFREGKTRGYGIVIEPSYDKSINS